LWCYQVQRSLHSQIIYLLSKRVSLSSQGPLACHTICITADGKVYTFGRNEAGQLGHGMKI